MKKLLTFILAALTLSISFSQESQASLIVKKTADWCPFCGTYGWTLFKKIKEETKDMPSIMIAMHHSGGLKNKTAEELNANFSGPGQPVFFNNGNDMFVTHLNIDEKSKEYLDSVKVRSLRKELIKVELKIVPKGNQYTALLEIENQVSLTNAQHTVSLFLLRDNLIFNQASVGPNASHTNVLSGALTTTTFGLPVYTGTITEKSKVKINQDFGPITLHNGKPDDVKIAAIVWNKNDQGKYDFVSGTILSLSQLSTTVESLESKPDFKVYQNAENLLVSKEKPGIISLYNLQGQIFFSQFFDQNEAMIDLNGIFNGVYLVQIKNNDGISTQRIIIEK
jgi:hypothetical protein